MAQSRENTMTPRGYITEALDRVLDEIGQVKKEVRELKAKIDQQNGKIDIIMRAVTGIGNF